MKETHNHFRPQLILRHALCGALLAGFCWGAICEPPESPLDRGVELFQNRQFSDAQTVFSSLKDQPRAQFFLGRLAFLERNLETAEDWFSQAAKGAPKESEFHFWLARTYGALALDGNALGRSLSARRSRVHFERAVELDPNHLEARYGLLRFHLIAPRMLGGNHQEAIRQAKAIAAMDTYSGQLAWAAIHEKNEDWATAEKAYRRAIELRPTESDGVLRWVWLLQSQGRFETAFSVLGDFLQHHPKHPKALYELGRTSAFSGLQTERGKSALQSYLGYSPVGTEPTLALAHFHLGMIHRHEQLNASAATAFRKALVLDPNLEEARRNLQETESAAP
ncbi:MAG: tetratricopeptide repeat protein [Deltaproteobacteria bacterium]|nr:tetratricopeptide repeat protein [Deltaproteobacteria bacterium]